MGRDKRSRTGRNIMGRDRMGQVGKGQDETGLDGRHGMRGEGGRRNRMGGTGQDKTGDSIWV